MDVGARAGNRREPAKQLTAPDQRESPPSLTRAAQSPWIAMPAAPRNDWSRRETSADAGVGGQRTALSGAVGCESSTSSGMLTSSENGAPEPAFWRPLTARRKLR